MTIYKIQASQTVYFTVLINAENDEQLNELVDHHLYPSDCYEHTEIDWQIDAISEANPQDLDYFPIFEREKA